MRPALALLVACACLAQQAAQRKATTQAAKTTQKTDAAQTAKSFALWLAQVSGLTATSSGLKGIEVTHQGDIWTEPIDGGSRQKLTSDGSYSWPVFSPDDRSVIALRSGALWSVPSGGQSAPVRLNRSLPGITNVLGSGPEGIVVLTADQVGTFSPDSGAFSAFVATSQDERDTINRMRDPVRSYGQGQLTVSERDFGIWIVLPGQKDRTSAPKNATLWQPSVSHDRKSLVYVRADK
jgi:hypothetical protein